MSSIMTDRLCLTLFSNAGPVSVLKDISLDLPLGKSVAVTGPSGSGKTSLLMVLGGLERPTAGAVRVFGHDLSAMSEDERAVFRRDNVGIVFQDFHLIPTMTALENVAVPLEFAGRSDAFDRAGDALAALGLAARQDHYPGQLSGGEQQRVAVARAFAPGPKLILADEPTGNLDAETGALVMQALFALQREQGATLLLVTHDADLAAACDASLRIRDGRIA